MEQFAILSNDSKSILKELLIDMQELDRVVSREEQNAKVEISKNAVPEGLEAVAAAAQEQLVKLSQRLSGEGEQNDS